MSCEDSENSSFSGQVTPPESTTFSSSRTSSSSNFGENGAIDGLADGLAGLPLPSDSAPLPSTLRSADYTQPQLDAFDTPAALDSRGRASPDVDPQIIEALKSKDRLFVLKLGEQMEALIRERQLRNKIRLSPENQYQRLLVHRCAQYYKLSPDNESKTTVREMTVLLALESCIPSRRISELVPIEHQPQATFKIMRRMEQDRRRQRSTTSRAGSMVGEDGDLSDPGPSESGSMGSRSTTSKKHMTIAEREAAYQAARSRIFMGFDEKAKDRDSASSSTFSLVSASGSGHSGGAGGSSVISDDDNASTAPTESEWSASGTDRRRGDSGVSSAGSTTSFRTNSLPYSTNGSGGGRASGTASPAITYPSLYDQSGVASAYEHAAYANSSGAYMATPYPMYAYPPPPHTAGQVGPPTPYVAAYPYYHPQFYHGPPPQPPHPASDPSSPSVGPVDGYHHPGMPLMGAHPYGWVPPPNLQPHHPPPDAHSPPVSGQQQMLSPPMHGPPPAHAPYPPPQYPYLPPPYVGYPPYFQPPPSQHPPLVHSNSQPAYPVEHPPLNGHMSDQGTASYPSSGNGSPSPTLSRHANISGNGQNGMGTNGKRSAPPARSAWSYGPGIGLHTSPAGTPIHFPSGNGGGEVVGPRLSSTVRRISGASSGSNGSRTPGDETASTASSSTSSSSSRRTYMSTPPKHPLPPRPDWAAGLKPQPTLHPTTRNRHDSNSSRTMSPAARPHQQLHHHHHPPPQQLEPIFLQSTDFPPLTSPSGTPADKRPAIAGGVWSNPIPARAILSPNTVNTNQATGNSYGAVLANHNGNGTGTNRLEEDEHAFERPPKKTSAELFNPKGLPKRPGQQSAQGSSPSPVTSDDKSASDKERGEIIKSAILNKVSSLKLTDQTGAEQRALAAADQGGVALKTPSPEKMAMASGSACPVAAVTSAEA